VLISHHPLGRVARRINKKTVDASKHLADSRNRRRNNAKQMQQNKKNAIVAAMRLFNGVNGTPRITSVIPLTPDVTATEVIASLAGVLDLPCDTISEPGLWHMKCVSVSTRVTLVF
jgi:pre-rRNA-processing protein TSR1